MSSEERAEVDSFMSVLAHTKDTTDGIVFEGRHMPSKNPVIAKGVTTEQLKTDRGMAEQWYSAVKDQYEREIEERHRERSAPPVHVADRAREDNPAEQPRGDAPRPEKTGASIEEELQARRAHWQTVFERCEWEKGRIVKELAEASSEIEKLDAAIKAISGG